MRKEGFVLADAEGRFLVACDQFLYGRNVRLCIRICIHIQSCRYIITCEKHRVAFAHAPPMFILSRVSYRIFAPSRARRLAGLKRRTTDNKPRNSCPANATGRYLFTRCIEVNVYPIRVDDTKVSHAHVRESCNVLMHPAIFFSFFQSFFSCRFSHSKHARIKSIELFV